MKLIHDCVREILLKTEEYLELDSQIEIDELKIKKFDRESIIYCCEKLEEANYIETRRTLDGSFYITNLTYYGHLFLDNIRDSKVWSQTKSIVSKFSSVSLRMIENIASQVISNLITLSVTPK